MKSATYDGSFLGGALCVGACGLADTRGISEIHFVAFAEFPTGGRQRTGHAVVDGVGVGVCVLLAAEGCRVAHLHVSVDDGGEAEGEEEVVILHGCGIEVCVCLW